jgi:hypothetical protein
MNEPCILLVGNISYAALYVIPALQMLTITAHKRCGVGNSHTLQPIFLNILQRYCIIKSGLGCAIAQTEASFFNFGGSGSIPGEVIWNLW